MKIKEWFCKHKEWEVVVDGGRGMVFSCCKCKKLRSMIISNKDVINKWNRRQK